MKKWAPVLIMIAAILWSVDGLLRRKLYSIPTPMLVMIEHLVGVLFLLPLWPKFWQEYKRMKMRDWAVICTTALIGGVLGTMFYTAALAKVNYIQYSVVILLQKTQPLFAVALAAIILKEKLTKLYLFLAILGLTAAYVISFPNLVPNVQGHSAEIVAAGLALGAAFCWGSATVLGKLVLHRLNFGAATTIRFLLVIPIAFAIAWGSDQTIALSQITTEQWQYFIGIALTSGAMACLIYYKGLQHTPAKISTFAEMMFPVSAVLIGFSFLDEKLLWQQWIAAFVLLGVILFLSLYSNDEKKFVPSSQQISDQEQN